MIVGGKVRKTQRLIHPDAEDQEIPERIDHVPEDEQRVRRADLSFPVHHCRQAAHERPPLVSSTKMSSRLAPVTSSRSTRPRAASAPTTARMPPWSSLTVTSTVF